jgi:SAM-dependent methyltransferase
MRSMKSHVEEYKRDIDAKLFYTSLLDPDTNFNKTEITLSHLFREPLSVLGDKTYSDHLFAFLHERGYLRPRILEVGGGLGDVALNYLQRAQFENHSYVMLDISHALLERQKARLHGLVSAFIEADCTKLSEEIRGFEGLILSNGMVADLRSIFLESPSDLVDFGITDPDIADFANSVNNVEGGSYLHVGSLLFIRELAKVLQNESTAAILEYAATPLNQPSWFDNHFECGIDFNQLEQYARRLGFTTEVVDIESILGLSREQPFLTIDVFTRQDRLARMKPAVVPMWRTDKPLEVRAYTSESLSGGMDEIGLTENTGKAKVLEALQDCFFSIHDTSFDTKNPATWGYKCLLLKKPGTGQWQEAGEAEIINLLSHGLQISEPEARSHWMEMKQDTTMGFVEPVLTSILATVIYESIKKYGPTVWIYFFAPALLSALEKARIEERLKQRVMDAAKVITERARREKEQ